MGFPIFIKDEAHFESEMENASTRLVVIGFIGTCCTPCLKIAPFFKQLATTFPRAVFLKVDVDRCPEIAMAQDISAMPTFIFYMQQIKIDRLQGAHPALLEAKIRQYYDTVTGDEDNNAAEHISTYQ